MFSSRESKGVGKFSFGGGLEGKLNFVCFFFFGGGGSRGAGVFLWNHGKPWHIPRESNLFPLDHTNFNISVYNLAYNSCLTRTGVFL